MSVDNVVLQVLLEAAMATDAQVEAAGADRTVVVEDDIPADVANTNALARSRAGTPLAETKGGVEEGREFFDWRALHKPDAFVGSR